VPGVVVDASALFALAFGEPEGTLVSRRMASEPLHAPSLILLELTNATLNRCRREPPRAPGFTEALMRALAVPITLYDVDAAGVLRVALATGLSAYDASYLWLAGHLAVELVTLDRRLQTAAATYHG
jgi:predicted nucleic acid-binding protein